MDLNLLLHNHQIALMRNDATAPAQRDLQARTRNLGSRFDIVSHYERRISRLRNQLGVAQYPAWLDANPALTG